MPLQGLKNQIERLRAFNWEKETVAIVVNNKTTLEDIQRDQMLSGKDKNGEWLRPFYSENPYFKKPGAAYRYAKWKSHISPNKQKPFDVPDLFIVGFYHKSVEINISGDKFKFRGTAPFAFNVENVHKTALGLNLDSRTIFIKTIFLPAIKEIFLTKTGFKIT